MEAIKSSLLAYALTIVLAMVTAFLIYIMASLIKNLKLDSDKAAEDISVPSSDSLKELETIAVAIAVAYAARKNAAQT